MANEPDTPVLVHLREIRAILDSQSRKFEAVDKRFDRIDERFDSLDCKLTNALGFAAMANLGAQHAEAKVSEVAERQKRMEVQMADFDRRLKRVEEPSHA